MSVLAQCFLAQVTFMFAVTRAADMVLAMVQQLPGLQAKHAAHFLIDSVTVQLSP